MSDRLSLELEPADTLRLANLCGQFDEHLKQIESRVGVEIFCRGNLFTIQGPERASRAARRLLINLYRLAENEVLTPDLVNLHLQESGVAELGEPGEADPRYDPQVAKKKRLDVVVTEHFLDFKNRGPGLEQILGIGVPQPIRGCIQTHLSHGFPNMSVDLLLSKSQISWPESDILVYSLLKQLQFGKLKHQPHFLP